MDSQSAAGVHSFTEDIVSMVFSAFEGKTLGEEGFTKDDVMKYLFGDKPKNENINGVNIEGSNNCLNITSESQGHGKPWEIDVLCIKGFCPETLKKYKQTEKYDGKEEDSPDNRNKSVKTTGKNAPDCGDIIRFLTSDNMDIIIICYKQEGDYKVVERTVTIDFDSVMKVIKGEFNGEDGFNTWINGIKDYIQCVKDAPKKTKIKELPCKKKLELSYFGIRPKTDQNRVQCELKLEKILPLLKENEDYKIEQGGFIDGKPYTAKIYSPPRKRGGISRKKLISFCNENNIKGYSKYNKGELIKYIVSKGYII
jgi:hypothetical protein